MQDCCGAPDTELDEGPNLQAGLPRLSTVRVIAAQRLPAQHGPQLHATAVAAVHGLEPRSDDLRRQAAVVTAIETPVSESFTLTRLQPN